MFACDVVVDHIVWLFCKKTFAVFQSESQLLYQRNSDFKKASKTFVSLQTVRKMRRNSNEPPQSLSGYKNNYYLFKQNTLNPNFKLFDQTPAEKF